MYFSYLSVCNFFFFFFSPVNPHACRLSQLTTTSGIDNRVCSICQVVGTVGAQLVKYVREEHTRTYYILHVCVGEEGVASENPPTNERGEADSVIISIY